MTAVETQGNTVLLDMGYDMETVVESEKEIEELTTTATIEAGAIPDDSSIHDKREDVEAIIIGHGHLDHVGAVPKLAGSYDCPIIATPFTMRIIERNIEQDRKTVDNDLIELKPGETYQINDDITLEFVDITHSIPQTVMTVLHTPEGPVVYNLDFRLDREPVLGDPPDFDRINELGEDGVKAFIGDSTRVDEPDHGRSETTVKTELNHVIDEAYNEGGAVYATTFASHVERLNSIIDANDGRRKIAFIGRSLREYNESAEELGFIDLDDIEVVSYRDETEQLLERISDERDEWLIICTGNQGEPNAALTRIANGEQGMDIQEGDHVIFSCSVIPTPVNEANRYKVEKTIREQGGLLYRDIHTSGHAKREGNREMIRTLEPENIIPAHGTTEMLASYATLAREEGYQLGKNIFLSENGGIVEIE